MKRDAESEFPAEQVPDGDAVACYFDIFVDFTCIVLAHIRSQSYSNNKNATGSFETFAK